MSRASKYFMGYQARWINDPSRMRICEKGRQIGMSYADSYDSVTKAAVETGKDVWVMSRDEVQAKQYILYCKRWSNILKYAADDLGEQVFEMQNGKPVKIQVLNFASRANIYALSSNPDAIVGKTGHVKLDEYALHKDQRTLFAVAKPVIQWGGTISILSTHRGIATVFNSLISDIKQKGNPMGWSLHTIPIQLAVEQGIVEKINAASGGSETRAAWLARQRAECIDEEQWLQEYCCIPADESTAFITYDLLRGCEDASAIRDFAYLEKCVNPLFLGWDVARTKDLSVIFVGEQVGDVLWLRYRLEMQHKSFSEQEFEFNRLMRLPCMRRACIDASGLGKQIAERGQEKFRSMVEPVVFTNQVKSDLAYPLKAAFEDKKLRYTRDELLIADVRGIKKELTPTGNERFVGESADSHCDRFWAWCLMREAASQKNTWGAGKGAIVI